MNSAFISSQSGFFMLFLWWKHFDNIEIKPSSPNRGMCVQREQKIKISSVLWLQRHSAHGLQKSNKGLEGKTRLYLWDFIRCFYLMVFTVYQLTCFLSLSFSTSLSAWVSLLHECPCKWNIIFSNAFLKKLKYSQVPTCKKKKIQKINQTWQFWNILLVSGCISSRQLYVQSYN